MATPYEESVSYSPSQQILGFSPQQAAREFAQEDNSMMQLAQFSKTLGGELMKYQEQVNKEQMMEGYNLAFQQDNPTEVSDEIRAAGESLKADEKDAHAVAYDINRSGESGEVALSVQNMSGWKRYGFAKGKAELAGQRYAGWLSTTLASDERTFYHPQTGQPFTLNDTARDPALRGFALAQLRGEYIDQQGLTGMKPAFLNEFAGKQIRSAEFDLVEEARKNLVVVEGQDLHNRTVNEFLGDRDLNLYMARIVNSRKENGELFSRSESWKELKRILVNEAKAGREVDLDELMDQPIDNDPKGRTFGDLYGRTQFQDISIALREANIDFMSESDRLEEEQADDAADAYIEQALANPELASPTALANVQAELVAEFGNNSSAALSKLQKLGGILYNDEKGMAALRATFQEKARRGELRPEDLEGAPHKLQLEFGNIAATQAKQASPDEFKRHEQALTDIVRLEAQATPDGARQPTATLMIGDLKTQYQILRQRYIESGQFSSPAEASLRASVELQTLVKSGIDDKDSLYYVNENGVFENYIKMKIPVATRLNTRNFNEILNTRRIRVVELGGKAFDQPNLFFNKAQIEELKTVLPNDPLLIKSSLSDSTNRAVGVARAIARETGVPLLSIINRQNDVLELPELPEYANYGKAFESVGSEAKRLMQSILDGSLTSNQRRRLDGTWKNPVSNDQVTANLKQRIRQAESGNNYSSVFKRHLEGFSRANEDPTEMTINQVVQYQKDYLAHQAALGIPVSQRSAAIGAYQMLYPEKAAKALGISLSSKFTPAVQDRLSEYYLDLAGRQQYLNGTISAVDYNNGIARQFASIKASNGMGVYDNDGLNTAYSSVTDLIQ